MEIEVFRLREPSARTGLLRNYPDRAFFSVNKCYEFAKYTRKSGRWPNEKYYTTRPMQYVGKYVRSERWGNGDDGGGADVFNNNGTEVKITLDYEGTISYREVPCRERNTSTASTSRATATATPATPATPAKATLPTTNTALVSATDPNIKVERDENLCVVCLKREKTNAFVPCGHMCVCDECGPIIMETSRKCPICSGNSSMQLHIYKTKYLKYKNKYLKLKNEMK